MPAITLAVCLQREKEHLRRLLSRAQGCFDDLVVVHDGPDEEETRELVEQAGGRFFERPRAYQQEPHWPFAWGEAKHDWILRLDADEFPSAEMQTWLHKFRQEPEQPTAVSGYLCIWPMWDGNKAVTEGFPNDRLFLLHRHRVRFFGMVEQTPIPDGACLAVPLVLCHEPKGRKNYGIRNALVRKRSHRWAREIAKSLMGTPLDLAGWRWSSPEWPPFWEQMRQSPLKTGMTSTLRIVSHSVAERIKARHWPTSAYCSTGLHHLLIGFYVAREKWRHGGLARRAPVE